MNESRILQMLKQMFLKKDYVKVLLYIAFVLLLCIYISNRITVIFTTNIELSTGESNNIWNIINVNNGKALYSNPEDMPFEIFQYSPLSQLIYVAVTKITSIDNYINISRFLRFFNLIVNCMVALGGFLFAKRYLKLSDINAFVVAFFCLLLLGHMCWIVRPDALSVFFLFYACIFAYCSLKNEKLIYVSSVLTVLALFTKQDAIQLFIIIPVSFFLIKRFRLGIKYFYSVLLVGFVVFLIFYGIYGDVFVKSVIGGVSISPSLIYAFNVLNRYLQLYNFYPILIVVASMYMIIKSKEEGFVFLSMLLIGAFIFALGTSLKPGAGSNYYTLANLLGVLILSRIYINMKQTKIIGILIICWAYYFFTGILFHYTSKSFDFSMDKYNNVHSVALEIRKSLPEDFKIYTTDVYLKLELAEHSILPNNEYYPESSFNLENINKESFYIYGDIEKDWLFINVLKNGNLREIDTINGIKLFSYGEK